MKIRPLCLALLAALLCAGAPLRAEDHPAPPPSPAVAAAAPAAPAPTAPTAPSADASDSDDSDNPPAPPPPPPPRRIKIRHFRTGGDNDLVAINRSVTLPADQTADQVVVIMGSADVKGRVLDQVVTIMGSSNITGDVDGQVVAVAGHVYVNSHVSGQVVSVMGGVELGPNAVVDGQVVSVGGDVERAPGAQVFGQIQQEALPHFQGLQAWGVHGLRYGRMLAWGAHLSWVWWFSAIILGFYVLLALVFRRAVEKCAETLERQPGFALLTALLTLLLMPLVLFLLVVTFIGIPVVPVLLAGLLIALIFGKVAINAWIGRRFVGPRGSGAAPHVALAVLLGGVILTLLYLVPVLGFLLWFLTALLGLGTVIYTAILSLRREPAKPAPVAPPPVPPAPVAPVPPTPPAPPPIPLVSVPPVIVAPVEAPPVMAAPLPPPTAVVPPPVVSAMPAIPSAPPLLPPAETLPRAGFWPRLASGAIDAVLIGLLCIFTHGRGYVLLAAVYCFGLWWWRGTTIGGIVLGLKIVRLDDRRIDPGVAVIRVLGAFLSVVCLGLGFIWVSFDKERQSWHDKIAGTTVVRVPKGISLI